MFFKLLTTLLIVDKVVKLVESNESFSSQPPSVELNAEEFSVVLTDENFDRIVKEHNVFVYFYAPWCKNCKIVGPDWEELARSFNKPESLVKIAKIDCTSTDVMCPQNDIATYPTFKLFLLKDDEPIKYKSSRNLVGFTNFLNSILNSAKETDVKQFENPKHRELTDETFLQFTSKRNHFVMLYAPWCEFCQRLAVTWEELFAKYDGDEKTAFISKLDCTEYSSICGLFEVETYPTLVWIVNGKKVETFTGGRSFESLEEYVVKMSDPKNIQERDEIHKIGAQIERDLMKGVSFVEFYMPWCGFCQKLSETWEKLTEKFIKSESVKIVKVDCSKHPTICKKYAASSYPTLLWVVNGDKVDNYISEDRTLESLEEYVEKMSSNKLTSNLKEELKQGALFVEKAVDDPFTKEFKASIKEGVTFVNFFKPQCGFCQKLSGPWSELTTTFIDSKDVKIKKVDCTSETSRHLCKEQGINGYPTMYLFKDGERIVEFEGDRTLNGLEEFVKLYVEIEEVESEEVHEEL